MKRFYFTNENGDDIGDDHLGNIRGARKVASKLANEYECTVTINDCATEDMIDFVYPDDCDIMPRDQNRPEMNGDIEMRLLVNDNEIGRIITNRSLTIDEALYAIGYDLNNEDDLKKGYEDGVEGFYLDDLGFYCFDYEAASLGEDTAIYRVEFEAKNDPAKKYVIDIEAISEASAEEICETKWHEKHTDPIHHVEARELVDAEKVEYSSFKEKAVEESLKKPLKRNRGMEL